MGKNPKIRLSRLRDIGWKHWDPIGLLDDGLKWGDVSYADEYDSYLIRAAGMLRRKASREEVVEYLVSIEAEHMGMGISNFTRISAEKTVDAIMADKKLWNDGN